jgi:Arc/MetJ-type ribon-helix-helix transcriptional regulator
MHIDIAPETERLVREEISSGHFRSADEVIKAGVEALREKNAHKNPRPLSARIRNLWADMPADVRAEYPEGGAYQIDHHVYGLPKR